jgi:hypothetical protein
MPAIPGIMVDIGANVAKMQSDMRRMTGIVNESFGQMHRMVERLGGTLAAALSVRVLVNFAKEALDTGDRMAKLSQSTGTSVEVLSSLNYAAKLSHIELDSLARSMGILSRNMLEAQSGTGEAKEALKALGVTITDSQGNLLPVDKVLAQVADKFAAMGSVAGRTGFAMKIFGRAGYEMIPMLSQGSAALADLRAEAEKLGLVMSEDMARQMERVNDNFIRLKSATLGLAIRIMDQLSPTLENLTNILIEAKKKGDDFNQMAEAGATGLKLMASAAIISWTALKDTGEMFGGLAAAFYSAVTGDIAAAIEIMRMQAKDSDKIWEDAGKILERIWDKNAEAALRAANRMKKATGEAPKLPGEADKFAEAIQKHIDTLFEQAEAMQMGADTLELYRRGLHNATGEQKDYALELIKTIKAYENTEAAKKQIEALELQALTFGLTARQVAVYTMQFKQIDPQLIKTADDIYKSIEAMQTQAEEIEKTKAIDKQIDALRMQALSFGITEKAAILYRMVIEKATPAQVELARSILDTIEAQKKQADTWEEGKRISESVMTPLEKHIEYMDKLQKLHDEGAISIQTYYRAANKSLEDLTKGEEKSVAEREQILLDFGDRVRAQNQFTADAAIYQIERQSEIFRNAGAAGVAVANWAAKEKQKASRDWQDGAIRGLQDYASAATNAAQNTEMVMTNAFKGMEDALVEFVKTGKMNFTSLVDSILRDLIRLMIRQNITGPLAQLFSAGIGSLFSPAAAPASAGVWTGAGGGGMETWGYMHEGGVVDSSAKMSKSLPATLLISAPRYHEGLKPDEFPTILKRGEGVFTPEQMKVEGTMPWGYRHEGGIVGTLPAISKNLPAFYSVSVPRYHEGLKPEKSFQPSRLGDLISPPEQTGVIGIKNLNRAIESWAYMHGGGITGITSVVSKSLPAPYAIGAPRYHEGLKPVASRFGSTVLNLLSREGGESITAGPKKFAGSKYNIEFAHEGGIIGQTSFPTQKIPASFMLAAPRFHDGLKPDEFPAILKRGEGIFTPEQMKALGNKTTISMTIPITGGGFDSRKKSQVKRDLENELEPVVKKIIQRYI